MSFKKSKKSKEPKYPAGISQEFIDNVARLDSAGMKNLIAELQKHIDDSRVFLKTNEEIVALRENLKESTASAKETITHMTNRTTFLVEELKKNGSL